jgi:ferrochelatase
MTYLEPAIGETMRSMQADGVEQIVVLPMFPQYSISASKSIVDQADASGVPYELVHDFYNDEGYLDALAKSIDAQWDAEKYDKLFLSYHGVPVAMIKQGDPYQMQCEATTAGVIERIPSLNSDNVQHVYQSKFGPAEWLTPALKDTLESSPENGVKRVLVATPAFVGDCLETLEEIHVENAEAFKINGGELFDVVSPFNDSKVFSQVLADIAVNKLA